MIFLLKLGNALILEDKTSHRTKIKCTNSTNNSISPRINKCTHAQAHAQACYPLF